jgi:transcription initiation factor TFIID subunit 5
VGADGKKKPAAAAGAAASPPPADAAVNGEGAKRDGGEKAGDAKGGDAMDVDTAAEEDDLPPHVRADGTLSESLVPLKRYRQGAEGLETEEDVNARAPLGSVARLAADGDTAAAAAGGVGGTVRPPPAGKEAADVLLPSVLCYSYTNTRSDGLNCSALSPDGSQVAAGFGDSTLRLWDAKASGTAGGGAGGFGRPAVRLVGHCGPVYSVDWTKCARFVLSGSEDGTVRLWSAVTHADLVAYRGHNYPVWSVGFSPLDHYFASGSHDRSARVWVTDRVYPLRILAGHLADVDTVRWHPNCNYVATGSSDRTARLWDLRDGRCVRVFGCQSGAVQSLAFSPNGRVLAIAGEARDIELWDIAMGNRISTLRGHTGAVWSMEYSKDGSVLASGGSDCTVRLWRADDASPTARGAAAPAAVAIGENGIAGLGTGRASLGKRARNGKAVGGGGLSDRSSALLATLRTKQTPIHLVHFTRRNLLIAAGSFSP